MVSPEQISISAYSLTDEQITFRLELLDGYCGGTIKTYTDENRNLYISVLRTVIKEELSDGETEIMNYGFNHEKRTTLLYIMVHLIIVSLFGRKAIYYLLHQKIFSSKAA